MEKVKIIIANKNHFRYAKEICEVISDSAKVRGTGIAKRTPEYIQTKIQNRNAIIAMSGNQFAGFCYIEIWGNEKHVAHSGLIVHPDFRNQGLAKKIKEFTFNYSLKKFPMAKVFGITTGLAVMKINSDLGYKPVTFSELTNDPKFWAGCKTCTNYDILTSKEHKMCLCTGMLYDPLQKVKKKEKWYDKKVLKRLKNIKQTMLASNKQLLLWKK
ncbi:acetyltransferase (GNAT) family protein [Aquimarina sp. MAR_2010_214]|uniref:GNAT family N-acetyltransferase n=1 Tax=Aquimarina sp. MAR_2010_214 TaxID=1250026 RepID=UPI000C70352D|nr:GNAT family N-acetyltransferase [Aquimarina sp. MAR_2010_214]PKV51982.1 acetyltransferase (GNAT) family protein [Aquimarina sp. MAR_2010_214]